MFVISFDLLGVLFGKGLKNLVVFSFLLFKFDLEKLVLLGEFIDFVVVLLVSSSNLLTVVISNILDFLLDS